MKYTTIGTDPRPVSVLAMGTHMNLGYSLNEAEASALVAAAIDGGINLFDTADAYADGAAETALGQCLKPYAREPLWILTKVGATHGTVDLSRDHMRRQLDASLRRLQTNYVDIYLCHHDDPATPVDAVVTTMNEFIDEGRVRHWGVSNWVAERIAAANAYARAHGLRPMTACQPRYNLLYRAPERDLFPTLLTEGVRATTFSPLGHGVLAGIYAPGQPPPPGTRAAMTGENKVTRELYYNEDNLRRAERLVALAREAGTTAAALATAWCTTHPAVASVIVGAWNAGEMQENLLAADLELGDALVEELDVLFPAPA